MQLKQKPKNIILLITVAVLVAVSSTALFLSCYKWDNKYTTADSQGRNGLFFLSHETLAERSYTYLIDGWEIYRGKLLEPSDFDDGILLADEYVFIGQFGGFEKSTSASRSPHGSATYRLNVMLPPETSSYTLELPEIYSSYKLYIDGKLVKQMGSPDPDSYMPATGNTFVTVFAADRMEILLAATDYSYVQSGMVYPPAFGYTETVVQMLNTRFAIRLFINSAALCIGTLYLCVWLLSPKRRQPAATGNLPLFYAALCLCFTLATCYPVAKTILTSSISWYVVENTARCLMYLLVVIIQSRVADIPIKRAAVVYIFAGFSCAWTMLLPFIMHDNLSMMMAYSAALSVYQWICAAYLLITSIYGLIKGNMYSTLMLCGSIMFGCSLFMERALPLFEPIRLGWFTEIAGAALVLIIGLIMAHQVAEQFRLSVSMENRVDSMVRVMDTHNAYYPLLLKKEEEVKAQRHDLRHHLSYLSEMLARGNIEETKAYLSSVQNKSTQPAQSSYCSHFATDMLLRTFAGQSEKQHTKMKITASLPTDLAIDDVDLCVILSNLLENALEAVLYLPECEREVSVRIQISNNWLGISTENTFDGTYQENMGRFISRKKYGREGVGLASVADIVEKKGGSTRFYPQNKSFVCEVLIPNFNT